MIKAINTLLVTTAICGLLAAAPAKAASDADRTAGTMPTVTTNDAGVVGSAGEEPRTAGKMPTATASDARVTHTAADTPRTAGEMTVAATSSDAGVTRSIGEPSRTAGSMPAFNRTGPLVPPSRMVSSSKSATHTRLTSRDVMAIQKQLADAGFYKSKVDGQFGPGTQQALRGYQSTEGLEANGFPTRATLQKLGVTPENAPAVGEEEPTGTGGAIYTETVENQEITEKSGADFVNVDTNSQNGGNCLHCTNGPIGNGGTKSMHSNAF